MNLADFGVDFKNQEHPFIGKTFGESNQLTVVGWSGLSAARNKIFVLKCSICSKDQELFGDGYFCSLKSNLMKGTLPCGCGGNVHWTEQQHRIRVTRTAARLGHTFITWASEYIGGKTKLLMLCCKHGLWNSTSLSSMLFSNRGCPKCAAAKSSKRETYPEDKLQEELKEVSLVSGYSFLGWAEDYKGKQTKCIMECKAHGIWRGSQATSLVSGNTKYGCPTCSNGLIGKLKQKPEKIVLDCIFEASSLRNIDFLGFVGEYRGTRTKLKLSCPLHGRWETCSISNFYKGASCPSCNGHRQREAYINTVEDDNTLLCIKFGISNNSATRLKDQQRKTNLKISNKYIFKFENPEDCKNAERNIKNSVVCGVIDKALLPDGYTETTYSHNIETIIKIFILHGGKQL